MTTPGVRNIPDAQLLAEITDRKKFNTVDYIKNGGVVLPERPIKLYLNVNACYRIVEIRDELAQLEAEWSGGITGAPDELVQPLKAEREELAELNEQTTLTVHLRGVHPAVDNLIKKRLKVGKKKNEIDEDFWEKYVGEFLAKSIVSVERPNGEIDDHAWEGAEVIEFYNALPDGESNRLWALADSLCHGVPLASFVVDAGFPGGSDVAVGNGQPEPATESIDGSNVG